MLKEPLLHFVVLGATIFGLFGLVGKQEIQAPAKIVVSAAQIANFSDGFARTWRRSPTERELQGLVEDYIREEVFYREGKAAGLDRDDVIIRRRVRQKMEFIVEDVVFAEPNEDELAAYFTANPHKFKIEDRLTFRHVFLSTAKRANTMESDVQQIATALAQAGAGLAVSTPGDPFLLGDEFLGVSQSDVESVFGGSFAKQLFATEKGRWLGPITSGYGQHFVFVNDRKLGSLPPLDTVRQAVHREWANARRFEATQKIYSTLRDRYDVVIETRPDMAPKIDP